MQNPERMQKDEIPDRLTTPVRANGIRPDINTQSIKENCQSERGTTT